MVSLSFCSACISVTRLKDEIYTTVPVDECYKCMLCYGILSDTDFRQKLAKDVIVAFKNSGFDGSKVIIAVNVPNSIHLREFVLAELYEDGWKPRETSVKNLFANLIQNDIERETGLRGSLRADLILTITIENDEFFKSDNLYLQTYFMDNYLQRKRKSVGDNFADLMYTRAKISEIASYMTQEIARKYNFVSPSRMAQFKINFEREKIYVAGRYCKFSRSLPQSPWTVDYDQPAIEGNSVSEKISNVMKTFCKAAETRFMSSGREDIDVRMLGNGRPFAVQIINAQITECFSRDRLEATLNYFKEEINKDVDIYVDHLALVTAKQAEKLNVGEEEKRKHYSALCYSRIPLTDEMLKKLEGCTPLTLKQNTVVRVLKRRALHERPRTIYNMRVCKLNDYRFMLKLETQAGTYIKEFVHGDFGRTTPNVGEILGIGAENVDILELDVEAVELEWPPS